MYEIGVAYRNIVRADRAAADRLGAFGSATPHEALGRVGLLQPTIRPIYGGAQVSGTAVTVLLQPGDNWMLVDWRVEADRILATLAPPRSAATHAATASHGSDR